MAKVSKTKQWELDHPDDRPCPKGPTAAKAWRIQRGISKKPIVQPDRSLWEKYAALIEDKWVRERAEV